MIQRIQSIWLLLVFLIAIGLAYLSESNNYLLFANALTAALAVVAILRYNDRPRQIKLCYGIMALEAVIIVLEHFDLVNQLAHVPQLDQWIRTFMQIVIIVPPVAGLVFAFLALRGIKKDENLVRSMDRLR